MSALPNGRACRLAGLSGGTKPLAGTRSGCQLRTAGRVLVGEHPTRQTAHGPCQPAALARRCRSSRHLCQPCQDRSESQNGRGWKGPLGSPSPTPCPRRVTHSRLHSTASRRGWNISREGDSTASLGSLGRGSVTLRGKKFFLIFSWSFLCFSLCPLPLVLASANRDDLLGHSPGLPIRSGPNARARQTGHGTVLAHSAREGNGRN